jgi:glucose-1-phosphate adenylyltransferase
MAALAMKPVTPINVVGVIMGGGEGRRLFPLTKERAKPAVPIGGKYRLVDIPISNCINSEIRQIYVLTQFNSASLNRHIHQSYTFDRFSRGFVEILAAQQTLGGGSWYQGTADAVRQNLRYFVQRDYDYIVILSGDQLYRMDFRRVLQQHVQTYADITVAVIPVRRQSSSNFGILQVNDEKRIVRFVEKPEEESVLDELKLHDPLLSTLRITSSEDHLLASMGIYVFNREILCKALDNDETDFGKHIIPDAISRFRVFAHIFQGYWEDVGTIKSFFEANLALCAAKPQFNLFDRAAPIYTHARFLPGSKIIDSTIRQAMIADGCVIHRAKIENSVIGVRSFISDDCELRDTITMGCDFYESQNQILEQDEMGIPHMSIGPGTKIHRAIIDKNVHIGENVIITDKSNFPDFDGPNYYIRDGLTIIPKNAVILAGTRI